MARRQTSRPSCRPGAFLLRWARLRLSWPSPSTWLAALGLPALFWTQIAWVPPTNFYGFDDWTIHYLVSRGIIDIPYANRPLELIWELPARWLAPHSFTAYLVLYVAYACLSSWCVFLLCRRLVPAQPILAPLAAALFLVWVPRDFSRLSHFERTMYTSFVFGTLAAFLAFVESWLRRSEALLALAILTAFVTARSYEAPVALLLVWPLFVAVALDERSRRFRAWAAAWGAFVLLAAVLIAQPLLFPTGAHTYQASIGMDLNPMHVAARLAREYLDHLAPLVTSPPSELAVRAVPVAVAVFAVVCGWPILFQRGAAEAGTPRALAACAGAGLALAGLAYTVLALSPAHPSAPRAWRMQFLSAPGIALFLAAGIGLAARLLRPRARPLAIVLAACWIVAVGTGRTLAMQRVWDKASYYERQTRSLSRLTELAPDLAPHTLVVVLDEGGNWRSTWGFRHAVQYLYRDRAMGYVWGSWDFMFPTRVTQAGIVCEPWPDVEAAWNAPPTLHRYDELVVIRNGKDGALSLAESWPASLPALPPGATYDPRARIRRSDAPLPERRILGTGGEGNGAR